MACDIGRGVHVLRKSQMIQLNPELWMMTPKGEGLAFLVTDYGMDHNKIFTIMLNSGEILDFDIKDCRRCENPSFCIDAPQQPRPHYAQAK
jgi:hypothetical protein